MRTALVIAVGVAALSGCAHRHRTPTAQVPPPPAPTNRRSSDSRTEVARTAPPPKAALAARSTAKTRAGAASRTLPEPVPTPLSIETGKASWYGHPYHGRAAADGEIYDMEKMTAAHRTLPFDTWVRVVNLSNEKAVEVRIIDRGPFVDGRIIDLSHAAAREIGMIGPGTADVRVEVISEPDNAPVPLYAVQVGAFRNRDNAERERDRMEKEYGRAKLVKREGDTVLWRVLVGGERSEDAAEALRERIHKDSRERNGFVVRLDS